MTAALAGDKQQGAELDVPVIEDTSNTKSKVMMEMMVIEDTSNQRQTKGVDQKQSPI